MLASIVVYIVIFVDQLTKWWADRKLANLPGGEIEVIEGVFSFKYSTNDGMAFGMLDDKRWIFLSMTTLIIAAITAFFVMTRAKRKHPLFTVSLAMVLGGGISNMIDRIFYADTLFCGEVIDFLYFKLINFAIFNIADAAVCVGEVLLVLYVLIYDSKIKDKSMFTLSAFDEKNENEKIKKDTDDSADDTDGDGNETV